MKVTTDLARCVQTVELKCKLLEKENERLRNKVNSLIRKRKLGHLPSLKGGVGYEQK